MAKDLFSVPIFFVIFREVCEAAIIISILLSFVEQLMQTGSFTKSTATSSDDNFSNQTSNEHHDNVVEDEVRVKQIVRRMRIHIWAGALIGLGIALAIGAAFIAVFYTKVNNLWAKSEQIWEGVFSIFASVMILIMGVAFIKMDTARVKWRVKLADAFAHSTSNLTAAEKKNARAGKWALLLLPLVTILREGLEAVVFVGGVSLSTPASSIPIAVIVGLIAGGLVGYIIYRTGSTSTLHWFLVVSTCLLFLVGAGLFSKGIGFFQYYEFASGVGGDVAETGDGTGSFRVAGNVWHLTYGNPEAGAVTYNGGWGIFNALFGWNNTATLGTVIGYCAYWILIMITLVYLRWKEGRLAFFGHVSAAHKRRAARQARIAETTGHPLEKIESSHGGSHKVGPESPSDAPALAPPLEK